MHSTGFYPGTFFWGGDSPPKKFWPGLAYSSIKNPVIAVIQRTAVENLADSIITPKLNTECLSGIAAYGLSLLDYIRPTLEYV